MHYTRKIASLLLALVMVFALATTAFAQDVTYSGGDAGAGSITITNASKGETYSVYKLFGAVLSEDKTSISYTGTIPDSLKDYFENDKAGNIVAKDAAKSGSDMSDGLKAALKAWVDDSNNKSLVSAEAAETQLVFKNLPYGYYVVQTTQGSAAVSVTSTKPNASVIDKNTTTPTLTKDVDGTSYTIGDTVTYTLKFTTANFDGETKITEYVIEDTLPDFLSNVTVTKITIGGVEYKVDGKVPQFKEKKITFPWTDKDGNHKYSNGAEVVITYTATLTEKATIGSDGNTNTATLTYNKKTLRDTETIYSYSFDVVKTKSDKTKLTGAKFELYDAKENGNKIPLVKVSDGVYRVATSAEQTAEDGFTSAVIEAGKATIKGLKSGTYWLEETEAPAGYNKLVGRTSVTISDANNDASMNETGNTYVSGGIQVINQTGTELPSTGGMGTTIFYILGSALVLAAGVLLVTKKRMSTEG